MAQFANKFNSAKQEWETPDNLFRVLDEEFHFDIDLAASSSNAKCDKYFSEKDDAMELAWQGTCWLNPPYGANGKYKLSEWVKKSFEEAECGKTTIVALIPARTNTNWWHKYCMKAYEIKFIKGRPKFGGAKYGLPQPLAVVVFSGVHEMPRVSTLEF